MPQPTARGRAVQRRAHAPAPLRRAECTATAPSCGDAGARERLAQHELLEPQLLGVLDLLVASSRRSQGRSGTARAGARARARRSSSSVGLGPARVDGRSPARARDPRGTSAARTPRGRRGARGRAPGRPASRSPARRSRPSRSSAAPFTAHAAPPALEVEEAQPRQPVRLERAPRPATPRAAAAARGPASGRARARAPRRPRARAPRARASAPPTAIACDAAAFSCSTSQRASARPARRAGGRAPQLAARSRAPARAAAGPRPRRLLQLRPRARRAPQRVSTPAPDPSASARSQRSRAASTSPAQYARLPTLRSRLQPCACASSASRMPRSTTRSGTPAEPPLADEVPVGVRQEQRVAAARDEVLLDRLVVGGLGVLRPARLTAPTGRLRSQIRRSPVSVRIGSTASIDGISEASVSARPPGGDDARRLAELGADARRGCPRTSPRSRSRGRPASSRPWCVRRPGPGRARRPAAGAPRAGTARRR